MNDEFIEFLPEDDEESIGNPTQPPWIIGIIDDEPSVHQATTLALKNVTIYDRPLQFYSAYNAKEGKQLVLEHPEMALVLLDVVMETPDAGLNLVDIIRNQLNNSLLQIILRTGQAGYAPEEEVIIRYEINAYKTKSELTRNKLFTTIATGLRSFQLLNAMEQSRNGLRAVIRSSASMLQERSVYDFSNGVLQQIDALFDLSADSLFCISQRPKSGPHAIKSGNDGYYVVAANEKYQHVFGKELKTVIDDNPLIALAYKGLKSKHHVFENGSSCLYLSTPSGWEGAIVAENSDKLNHADQELLTIFCMNVALGLENAKFFSYLNKAAFTDTLTGLANRSGIIEQSNHCKSIPTDSLTMYVINVDYFHQVVESLGYDFGDALLKAMAASFKRFFPSNAIMARLHSDVFAILINDSKLTANDVANRCSRPILIDGQSIRMGLTVGSSTMLDASFCGENTEKLLRQAELALKVAKEQKRGSGEQFDQSYEIASRRSMTVLSDFRIAVEQGELFLVYQPKVNMRTNAIVGFEALLRWQHPKQGVVPPGGFITFVEKSGMYYDLDLYVAKALCKTLKKHDFGDLPISFNISANSLKHESFVDDLCQIFWQNNIDISHVHIEVTENALIHSEQAISRLEELQRAGFCICLDDFGAGFSSLSYLLRLPIDVIKIDRAFVAEIQHRADSLTLMEGIIRIVDKLNKQIIVEGVETAEQLELLKQFNVHHIQGYFFYKPLPLTECLALVTNSDT